MTLYQYNLLKESEQFEHLWDEGVFLADKIELPFKFALYQIHSFYIELKYHSENNVLQGLRTFQSTNQLEPYLDKIKHTLKVHRNQTK